MPYIVSSRSLNVSLKILVSFGDIFLFTHVYLILHNLDDFDRITLIKSITFPNKKNMGELR